MMWVSSDIDVESYNPIIKKKSEHKRDLTLGPPAFEAQIMSTRHIFNMSN